MKGLESVSCAKKLARAARSKVLFVPSLLFVVAYALAAPPTANAQQSTADVCRETKIVYEQYQREYKEAVRLLDFKEHEKGARDGLAELRRAITGGYVSSILGDLTKMLGLPEPSGSKANKLAFQKTVRSALEQEIQKARDSRLDDLNAQVDRLAQQIETREERMRQLDCDKVLAREQSSNSSSGGDCKLKGTWTQDTRGIGSTDWRIESDGIAHERGIGNADGNATLNGNVLHIDWHTRTGYSGYYEWTLDDTCTSSVKGTLQFKTGRTDSFNSTVKRTGN